MSEQTNRDHAEAIARAALTHMAERAIAPTPENFQLWYAYAAGENPELTRAIDALALRAGAFDESTQRDLRQRYLGQEKHDDIASEVSHKVAAELDAVLQILETAGKDNSAYGRALSQASGELGTKQLHGAGLKTLIDGVIGATRAMEARSKVLEKKLQTSSREVTDLRGRLESVRKESLTDQLTGVANRKAFDTELRNNVQRAGEANEPLCLLMCDVDRFKKFNDTWGHQTGDQVLRLVASCLSENIKGRDTAARYGGEEFAVILPQTALADAIGLANQIRAKVESKKLVKKSTGDILGTITISVGVALYEPGENLANFIQRADACLYAAKRTGRNLVVGQSQPAYTNPAGTAAA